MKSVTEDLGQEPISALNARALIVRQSEILFPPFSEKQRPYQKILFDLGKVLIQNVLDSIKLRAISDASKKHRALVTQYKPYDDLEILLIQRCVDNFKERLLDYINRNLEIEGNEEEEAILKELKKKERVQFSLSN